MSYDETESSNIKASNHHKAAGEAQTQDHSVDEENTNSVHAAKNSSGVAGKVVPPETGELVAGHTPLPWAVHPVWPDRIVPCLDTAKHIGGSEDEIEDRERFATPICQVAGNELSRFEHDKLRVAQSNANARLIVNAVNSHIALVAALRDMLTPPLILESDNACDVASWFVERARAALTFASFASKPVIGEQGITTTPENCPASHSKNCSAWTMGLNGKQKACDCGASPPNSVSSQSVEKMPPPSLIVTAEWVIDHHDWRKDHACAECIEVYDGTSTAIDGFQCVYHRAKYVQLFPAASCLAARVSQSADAGIYPAGDVYKNTENFWGSADDGEVARRLTMMMHDPAGPNYAAIENAIASALTTTRQQERRFHHEYVTRILSEHEEQRAALIKERDDLVEQFELLDDPDGLYSETKSRIESAARQQATAEIEALKAELWKAALAVHQLSSHNDQYGLLPFDQCMHPNCIRWLALATIEAAKASALKGGK